MSRVWFAAALAIAGMASVVACNAIIGLREPTPETNEGGADDADNGEPSTTYPAFEASFPRLVSANDRAAIAHPGVRLVTFSGDAGDAVDTLAMQFYAASGLYLGDTSTFWSEQTSDYTVRGASVSLVTVTETPPMTLTDDEVKAWLIGKLDGSHSEFGLLDETTLASEVFLILYPPGTTVTTVDGGSACPGYHNEVEFDTRWTSYVVLPRCNSGPSELYPAGLREVIATVTNPRPVFRPGYTSFDQDHLAWNFLNADGATEVPQPCGDFEPVIVNTGGQAAVARSWSNTAIAGYGDPCVPTPDSTNYFASVPVMTDDVSVPGGYKTKGIQLRVGEYKIVDVLLWSQGPTDARWTVNAEVAPGFPDGALGFAFDRTMGTNGEKLHLRVTANEPGVIPFKITSTLVTEAGTNETRWMGIVGQ
jgi:hypothetical protein